MIISGGSRSNGKWFATHLLKTTDNERVSVIEIKGLAADDVREAFREMEFVAGGTQCENYFYHVNMNPKAHESLTPEQWEEAEAILERQLKLEGHARFVVEHEKDGRTHRHVVWSRIDPETMTAVSDSFTARDHEKASREIETTFGLEPVESVLTKDREAERPDRGPRNWEVFRGQGGISPEEIKAEITALYHEADGGAAFKAALEDAGYILAKGDRRDFVIVDGYGHEHSLARRISGVKAADVRERLSDIDREALPSVAEARELARQDNATGDADSGQPGAQPLGPEEFPGQRPLRPEEFPGKRPLGPEESPGQRPLGAPENPSEQRPETPGEGRHDAALAGDGDIIRTQTGDGAPERVSPWGSAWRALADRAAHYADRVYALWRDERSGTVPSGAQDVAPDTGMEAPATSESASEARKSWVERVMDSRPAKAMRDLIDGYRHRDGKELAAGVEETAAVVEDILARGPQGPRPSQGAEQDVTAVQAADGPAPTAETLSAFDRIVASDIPAPEPPPSPDGKTMSAFDALMARQPPRPDMTIPEQNGPEHSGPELD